MNTSASSYEHLGVRLCSLNLSANELCVNNLQLRTLDVGLIIATPCLAAAAGRKKLHPKMRIEGFT